MVRRLIQCAGGAVIERVRVLRASAVAPQTSRHVGRRRPRRDQRVCAAREERAAASGVGVDDPSAVGTMTGHVYPDPRRDDDPAFRAGRAWTRGRRCDRVRGCADSGRRQRPSETGVGEDPGPVRTGAVGPSVSLAGFAAPGGRAVAAGKTVSSGPVAGGGIRQHLGCGVAVPRRGTSRTACAGHGCGPMAPAARRDPANADESD